MNTFLHQNIDSNPTVIIAYGSPSRTQIKTRFRMMMMKAANGEGWWWAWTLNIEHTPKVGPPWNRVAKLGSTHKKKPNTKRALIYFKDCLPVWNPRALGEGFWVSLSVYVAAQQCGGISNHPSSSPRWRCRCEDNNTYARAWDLESGSLSQNLKTPRELVEVL